MTAVLALGSNLGDRLAHLRCAVDVLAPYALSPVYETEPVGGPEQGPYLNAVVLCHLDAAAAWARAQEAERRAGRERTERWGPRTLDVDVICAPGSCPGLELPHPRAAERAFVLVPWHDVDPQAELPGHGRVADLLPRLDTSGLRRAEQVLR